ncbi:MAG TPA: aminotransferase [Fibrobacteres bacterium]|nr:aminotransferase [Fibrobacterota bacterium]
MSKFKKSTKLDNVLYDIRGPILEEARRMEDEGLSIIKLNIGNPAPFGLHAPDEIIHDMIVNLRDSDGYSDSKGLFSARKAIMQYYQQKDISGITIDDIYTGNGVSELVVLVMQALCNAGTEVLVPSPDYPLWTAAVNLAGGKAVHYLCDEKSEWNPDIADIKKKITSKTKAIVIINPNNPTGALYSTDVLKQIVKIAQENNLIVFSDEIYDKICYDGLQHVSTASLADDVLFVTFSGLSKSYRIAGFRAGWMVVSGDKNSGRDYIEGLNLLSSMRLCSNVPAQAIIQTALGGYQSINDLIAPSGRLYKQRDICMNMLAKIPGLTCVRPKAAFYVFPKLDQKKFSLKSDEKFVYDFLHEEKVLLVAGKGFNWMHPDHFRIVFLPAVEDLKESLGRLGRFLKSYTQ